MPMLPNGRSAPKKKKPAPARKSRPVSKKTGLPKSYAPKLKKQMTNASKAGKAPGEPKSGPGKKLKATTPKTRKNLPGYKVPSKLLKGTAANKKAGLPSLADVLSRQDKSMAEYKKKTTPKSKKPATPKKKPSSDWEKGMSVRDWARGQDWYKGRD